MQRSVIISLFAIFSIAIIGNGRGPAYPSILSDFEMGPRLGSLVFSLGAVMMYMVSSTASKWLPKTGVQGGISYFFFAQWLSCLLFSLSVSVGHSKTLLFLGSALMGVGLSGAGACMNLLVTENPQVENKKRWLSGVHSIYALVSLGSPLLMNFFYEQFSWHHYFIFVSFIPLGLALWVRRNLAVDGVNFSVSLAQFQDAPRKLKWTFALFLSLNVMAEVCVSTRLVYYLVEVYGMSTPEANDRLSLFFVALFLARISGLLFFKKAAGEGIVFLFALSAAVCVALGLYWHPFFLTLMALPMGLVFPFTLAFARNTSGKHSGAVVFSVHNFMSFMLMVMHFSFGNMVEWFGLFSAMHLPLVTGSLSLLVFLYLHFSVLPQYRKVAENS